MHICFFNDHEARHLKPLTLTRPVWDLRLGVLTIREKWEKILTPVQCYWHADNHLSPVFKSPDAEPEGSYYYLNSRLLPSESIIESVSRLNNGEAIYHNSVLLACKLNSFENSLDQLTHKISFKRTTQYKPILITYLWELLEFNKAQIQSDISLMKLKPINGSERSQVIISKPEQVYISESAVIEPGVIIMGDSGPVYIGENTTLEAGCIIKGPAAVCNSATVKMKARIYDATTIGPVCKIGGEVSHSIFHSYSNKAHDGFVGNSLFGQWCNLGADTNTSNLKNNYDFVRIQDWETREPYKIGFQFFGTVMGDHSKTSINTMLSTGTTCGVSSNIFTSGFPPKFIPSFTWVNGIDNPEFRFDKAIEVMKAMMARRKVELSHEYEEMMRQVFLNKM